LSLASWRGRIFLRQGCAKIIAFLYRSPSMQTTRPFAKAATILRGIRAPLLQKPGAFDSAKNHKRQRRKRQYVTAKREKSQTPTFV